MMQIKQNRLKKSYLQSILPTPNEESFARLTAFIESVDCDITNSDADLPLRESISSGSLQEKADSFVHFRKSIRPTEANPLATSPDELAKLKQKIDSIVD